MGPKERLRKRRDEGKLRYHDNEYVNIICAPGLITREERQKKRTARQSRTRNQGGKPTTKR